jgi:hypothetical protein
VVDLTIVAPFVVEFSQLSFTTKGAFFVSPTLFRPTF